MTTRPTATERANPDFLQYELDARTLREKTERLKALRLARAAAEPGADSKPAKIRTAPRTAGSTAAVTKGGKRGSAKSGKSAKSSSSLSDWLKDQEALGRKP